MRNLLQDLGYAARQLRANPGFTIVVVLAIALGIGANTAMFSVVNGFVRPLPVKAPDQIVVLAVKVKGDDAGLQYRFSYPALADLRNQAEVFSDVFGYDTQMAGLSSGGKATTIMYSPVTGNYFSALGVRPAAGRLFVPGEGEQVGSEPSLVLGYSFWRKRFGGDPSVVGRQVRVDGSPATIIGVAPKGFRGLYEGLDYDCYLTLNQDALVRNRNALFSDRLLRGLTVVGRLKRTSSLAQAESAVTVVARRMAEQYPATDRDYSVRVIPERLARPMPLPSVSRAAPLVGAVFLFLAALVLLVACMNVANLLMVRATLRRQELAIRAALGSSRARLIRQMVTESLLLAFLGGAAGVILGAWACDAASWTGWSQISLPAGPDFSLDWRVFTYAFAAAAFTGLAVGLWPAFRGSRTDINAVLHESGRSGSGSVTRHRVRNFLVIAQVGASLMILMVAGLLVRSLQQGQRLDLGFDPDHVLNVALEPHQIGYDQARAKDFFRELETRVRALPGVQSASLALSVPMGYWNSGDPVYVEGRTLQPGEQPPAVMRNNVDPAYFETMRVSIVRGRAFRDSDNETAALVAIVNETMAKQFWPNQDPIGKRFQRTLGGPFLQVVGVARQGKYMIVFEPNRPYFYIPQAQDPTPLRVLQVRSSISPDMPPELLSTAVQQVIQSLDPEMPIVDLRPMRDSLAGVFGFMMFRFGAVMAGAMGILGLTLAVVGVYGVISFAASQRTREMGIRMALGAQPRDVLGLVLREGVRLVLVGVAAGLVAAAAMTRVIARFLFVSPTDPLTFGGVTALLGAVALWACYVPARRAMRADPMTALRHE